MRILKSADEYSEFSESFRRRGSSVGFVPTMGALHEGHLSLVRRAQKENHFTTVSVFVNPSQFNDPGDYHKYPRHEVTDLALLEAEGVDAVFLPDKEEVFPEPDNTRYELGPAAKVLEGKFRPGHFNGVASVVKRFLELAHPNKAYFGLKDYQQYLVVKYLVSGLHLDTEIIGCPIVREPNGLAMSSRNERLNPAEREKAGRLYESLQMIKETNQGRPSDELGSAGRAYLKQFTGIEVEYFAVVDPETMRKPDPDDGSIPRRALLAAHIGGVRLIDNMGI